MQDENKKQDIDKLRIILDNPYNTTISTKDEQILETVRRRLTRPYPQPDRPTYKATSDSLEPTVTIHGPPIKQTPTLPTTQKTTIEETKKPGLIIKTEDLYEIEKIETTPKTTVEQQPVWIPVEEETKTTPTPQITQIETTPPPIEKQPSTPTESIKEETPVWEEITEEQTIKPETQPTIEKTETITDQKPEIIDTFKDITIIDKETAIKLYNHGITSTTQLKDYKVKNLVKIGINKKIAKEIIKEAKKIVKKEQPAEITIPSGEKTIEETKEITEEGKKPTDEWTLSQQNRKNKATTIKIPDTDWEPQTKDKTPSIKPYIHGEYTLYKKEIITPDGKKRVIHFFSKQKPLDAEPEDIPEGFEVKINNKTGLPYLKKKT